MTEGILIPVDADLYRRVERWASTSLGNEATPDQIGNETVRMINRTVRYVCDLREATAPKGECRAFSESKQEECTAAAGPRRSAGER